MWRSHKFAEPPNAPLFYGPFATDPVLYTDRILEGFDAWLGVGQLLTAPQVFEGGLTREIYFPKQSANDESLYFDLHAPFGAHKAGTWATIATPIEHGGLFAREGAVIPIGKEEVVTVKELSSGPPRASREKDSCGIDRQVGQDDWRGLLLFPGRHAISYTNDWTEDDGVSAEPVGTCEVNVTYSGTEDIVRVIVTITDCGFWPLWDGALHIILPQGDCRTVEGSGARRTMWKDRVAWLVRCECDAT